MKKRVDLQKKNYKSYRPESKKTYKDDNINKENQSAAFLNTLSNTQFAIEVFIAILLLTGQISTTGVFIVPEGLALSASGGIFGFPGLRGRSPELSTDLDFLSVISALLLIYGQVRVLGPYVSGSGLFIVYSGEIFGYKSIPAVTNKFPKKHELLGQIITEEMLSRLRD